MRRLTRREVVLAVPFVSLIAGVLIWWPSPDPVGRSTDRATAEGTGTGSLNAGSSFTISGDVSGAIAPGVMLPLDLTLDNPNDLDLAIERITVTLQEVDAPGADADHPCSGADFKVRSLTGSVVPTLAANGSDDLSDMGIARAHWPAVGMRDRPVNQDGCKGAVLALGYQATGVEVQR